MQGKFIVFEGIDGSGKTTLIDTLKKELSDNFFFTREPYGTDLKNNMQHIIQHCMAQKDDMAAMLAFSLERSYHIKNYIIPKLDKGKSVISDRSIISTLAYQGITLPIDLIAKIYNATNHGIVINQVFFCSIDPHIAHQRIKSRQKDDFLDDYYLAKLTDINTNYQRILASYPNTHVLDMTQSIEHNTLICKEIIKRAI